MYIHCNIIMQSHFLIVVPCLPSPCINNGNCVAVNSTSQQLLCNCIGIYSGNFCEFGDKVRMCNSLIGKHLTE